MSKKPTYDELEKRIQELENDRKRLEQENSVLKEREESVSSRVQASLELNGDIGSLSLCDIIDREALQSMMEEFCRLAKIGSTVMDLSGNILVAVGWQDICVKFHRCHPETNANCLESDTLLSSGVAAGSFKAYRCKNNMWDMVTPIEVGGRHMGNIFLGHFFYEDEILDYDLFRSQARQYGFDETEYLAALERVPRLSKETVNAAMTFFTKLAGMISSLCYSNINLSRTLSQQVSVLRRLTSSEKKLQRSETLLKNILDLTPAYICAKNLEGRFLLVNQRLANFYGRPAEELTGMLHAEVCEDEEELSQMLAADRNVIKSGQNLYIPEETMENRDGSVTVLETHTIPFSFDGAPAVLIMAVDITERKKVEELLDSLERRNQALLDHSPVCHKIVDLDFNLQYMSANGFNMLKLDHNDEVYGKPYPFEFFPVTFRNEMTKAMKRSMETGDTHTIEALTNDVEGNDVFLYSTIVPVLNEGEVDYLTVVSVDVTQQKLDERDRLHLESQLQQSQKMESIGRLAGGVAHDFNNMLSIIIGNTGIIFDDLDDTNPVIQNVHEIQKAAERSRNLTRQLLAFARKQTISPKEMNLNDAIDGTLSMLRRLIGENIKLAWLPKTNLWRVKIDPSQIDQVLANLCVNAKDAIKDVGRITIETDNISLDMDYCREHDGFTPGDYVMIVISDNGCGMGKDVLENTFEPFFTTKGIGEGTGLGLATVYGIVKQNNGFINVYSEVDNGTTFRLYFPRYAGKLHQAKNQESRKTDETGCETILLVEDEDGLLRVAAMMLKRLGYNVLAASNPTEAIAVGKAHPEKINLLVTDIIMPGMNGKDLAKKMYSLIPNLKCLFMSGYTADVIAPHGVLDAGMQFIQKPFSRQELATKVRQVLDRA